ncbi:hypothetical protein COB57_06080 [Candidatus Peregrinibacteria bacterium]|nr:MAG: hypothetical protein COB57_06080 [Candidatus Peregrinibacteria bacterium]
MKLFINLFMKKKTSPKDYFYFCIIESQKEESFFLEIEEAPFPTGFLSTKDLKLLMIKYVLETGKQILLFSQNKEKFCLCK